MMLNFNIFCIFASSNSTFRSTYRKMQRKDSNIFRGNKLFGNEIKKMTKNNDIFNLF